MCKFCYIPPELFVSFYTDLLNYVVHQRFKFYILEKYLHLLKKKAKQALNYKIQTMPHIFFCIYM